MSSPFDFDPNLLPDQQTLKMIRELAEVSRLAQPSPEILAFQQQTEMSKIVYKLTEPYKQLVKDLAEVSKLMQPSPETLKAIQQQTELIKTAYKLTEPYRQLAIDMVRELRLFQIPPINMYLDQLQPYIEQESDEQKVLVEGETDLIAPDTKLQIIQFSPSFPILEKLLRSNLNFDLLHWRDFEKLVAELLLKEGYHVQLGRGTKDNGVDILAVTEMEGIGPVMSVWQAKKYDVKNPIGIGIIRELITTRNDLGASKAVIVTTTYLTGPAITRVQSDKYRLAKLDRDDLINWIRKAKQK